MLRLLVVSILFAGTAMAADQTFDYKIPSHSTSVEQCHQVARDIGVRVGEETGVEIVFARCEKQTKYGFDLLVRYRADEELNLVTTDKYSGVIDDAFMYESKEVCEEKLGEESAFFAEATGLQPVVSYCYTKYITGKTGWAMRIDSFGTPVLKPLFSNTSMSSFPASSTNTDEMFVAVTTAFEARDAAVRKMNLSSSFAFHQLTVFYYGESKIALNDDEILSVKDTEQCEVELAIANDLFRQNDRLNSIFNFCSRSYLVPSAFIIVRLRVEDSTLSSFTAVEEFEGYAECAANRAQLIGFYNDELGYSVKGALCGIKDREWHLEMFE